MTFLSMDYTAHHFWSNDEFNDGEMPLVAHEASLEMSTPASSYCGFSVFLHPFP